MPLWSIPELKVFRLEYHFAQTYASPAQIQDHLLAIMQRCFGTLYRSYTRAMINAQLNQERYRGHIPDADVKSAFHYSNNALRGIAFNRIQDLASGTQSWSSAGYTIAAAFPYFNGVIFMHGGQPRSNPEKVDGFDVIKSAAYIEYFTVNTAGSAWPRYIRQRCMELFNERAYSGTRDFRRYSNNAIRDRLINMVRWEDIPLYVTADAVEYCIWSHIRTLPPSGQLERAIDYCWGRSEL